MSPPCSGARTHLLEGHTAEITSHQFDARILASASLSGHVRVWDLRAPGGRCVHVLDHGSPVHAFQYDGTRLVGGVVGCVFISTSIPVSTHYFQRGGKSMHDMHLYLFVHTCRGSPLPPPPRQSPHLLLPRTLLWDTSPLS